MSIAFDLVSALWRKNRIFCSRDYDDSLAYIQNLIPLSIYEYKTDVPHKGWVVPPCWELIKAEIRQNGKVVYTADHPLKIVGLSKPFKGTLSAEELKKHLFGDQRDKACIPYHFRQHYRPWDRDFGFCAPQGWIDSLSGEFEIEIVTQEEEGVLKVGESVKHGKYPYGFSFVAHLDHPGMANDDLAGVAVGVELMHRLQKRSTKWTYRLVLVQEMIGSVFYLDKTLKGSPAVLESCFLEMLGSNTPLQLQASHGGKSMLEELLGEELKIPLKPYRSVICNDEAIWEAHGIPMCSLSRFPYPEYHSDRDNLSIISPDRLDECCAAIEKTIDRLEQLTLIEKTFKGVYATAHPDYQLYVDPGQPAFGGLAAEPIRRLRALMDDLPLLPRYFFLERVAKKLQLAPLDALRYLEQWEEKGLLEVYK